MRIQFEYRKIYYELTGNFSSLWFPCWTIAWHNNEPSISLLFDHKCESSIKNWIYLYSKNWCTTINRFESLDFSLPPNCSNINKMKTYLKIVCLFVIVSIQFNSIDSFVFLFNSSHFPSIPTTTYVTITFPLWRIISIFLFSLILSLLFQSTK